MDKLEIDARLAKVERSVSRLWMLGVALPAFLLLFVATVLVAVPAVRGREEMVPAEVKHLTPPTPVAGPTDPWAVEDLACELGKVNDLMNEAIISTPQRDAKKAQLLARPVRSGDLKGRPDQSPVDAGRRGPLAPGGRAAQGRHPQGRPLNRSRRGIGGLMILTALVALAMTAGRTPRRIGLVASIVAPTVVGIAVVGARFGLGRTRAFCAGFAAVGVACVVGSPADCARDAPRAGDAIGAHPGLRGRRRFRDDDLRLAERADDVPGIASRRRRRRSRHRPAGRVGG